MTITLGDALCLKQEVRIVFINEVCKLTGLTKKAVEYYEKQGLLSPEIRYTCAPYQLLIRGVSAILARFLFIVQFYL